MVTDLGYMRRALFHAARAVGATSPNPMVGALVVSPDGIVVGQGRHTRAGAAHAEVVALEEAGERARGATMYVTLEPCCHHGRTGPCTARIRETGISRVVAAMTDPNPRVNGKGLAELREHGIVVEVGLCEAEAAQLNRAFVVVHTLGRPLVMLKAAVSVDGCIAARPGERTAITSAAANRRTQCLRAMVDAVAIGSGTLLADDPLLTVRESVRARPLVRVVFDRRLRTPPAARLFSTLDAGPVVIVSSAAGVADAPDRVAAIECAGGAVVAADSLAEAVSGLLLRDVSSLLVEGGAELHAALWHAHLVDEMHLVVAPLALGSDGVPLFAGRPIPLAALSPRRVEPLGPDMWMEFDVYRNR